MVEQPKLVDATFYAVVTPEFSSLSWDKDEKGRRILRGAKVERITQKRPQTVRGGAVVTRLTLRMDAAVLLPLEPQAVIHVSPGQVEVIEVQADAPESDEDES